MEDQIGTLPLERQVQVAIGAQNKGSTGNGPEPTLARKLKEVSGLGVASLARIVGVSRTRFHLWLNEGGIGPEKIPHVMCLIDMFRDLRPIVGSDMRGFVRSQSPAGSIEQLLNRGETKAVMGLALHPAVKQQRIWQGENPARQISEVPEWIRPSRRLAWEPAPIDCVTRQQTLDGFGASSAGMDVYVPGAECDDDVFPGRRFNHPALPDKVVEFVASPIVSKIRELREASDPTVDVLADVADVRIAQLQGDPPYEVKLLFVANQDETSNGVRLALARLIVDMRGWLSDNARIVAWDVATLYEISAGDYLNTVPLYAEHLTYRGAMVEGAEPSQFGYEDFA